MNTLQHTFDKNAWHGPAVLEALEGITEEQSKARMGNSHSIIELVAHMTSWRNFVCEKLEGNDDFDVTEELNFPLPVTWRAEVLALKKSQDRLLKALAKTSAELLDQQVPGRLYKFRIMLQGIIHHDLYHTGQIVLLKKTR